MYGYRCGRARTTSGCATGGRAGRPGRAGDAAGHRAGPGRRFGAGEGCPPPGRGRRRLPRSPGRARAAPPAAAADVGRGLRCRGRVGGHLARRATAQRLFVLWIDAHGDLNTPASSPSGTAHGMPLRLLLDADADGALPAPRCLMRGQVALVGVRDLDPAEVEYVRRHDLPVLDCATLGAQPPGWPSCLHPALRCTCTSTWTCWTRPRCLPWRCPPRRPDLRRAGTVADTALRADHQVVGVGITEYVPQLAHDQQVLNEVLGALGLTIAPST